jgi:tetratricopeptide (TPR) repeat protein
MHQAFYNWGISCSKMYDATKEKKWLEEAFEKYNKATEIKPDYHEAFTSWGIACGKMYGATKKKRWLVLAIEKCQRALAVAPEIRDANYNIACAYALLGESEKMLMNLKEAIDYDSKYKEMAREDDDFKAYWDDPDFIALTK